MATIPTQTIKKITGKPTPALKSRVSTRQLKLFKEGLDEESVHHNQQWLKRRSSIWPLDNQNPYIDKDTQEVTKTLVCANPQLPIDLVEFSFKDGKYVPVVVTNHNITLINFESSTIHVESQEAKDQLQGENIITGREINKSDKRLSNGGDHEQANEFEKDIGDDEVIGDEVEEEEVKDLEIEKSDIADQQICPKSKKLMNQFNFCERATLTYNNQIRDESSQTTPPLKLRFNEYVTQWIIYDAYKEDYEAQQKEKDRGRKEKLITTSQTTVKKDIDKKPNISEKERMYADNEFNGIIAKGGLLLERMINQNMFDDVLHDFRYYEDPSDEFRECEGTLLPLWSFQPQDNKKLPITDIRWSPRYFDLFAVSFGSFDIQNQLLSVGHFCLWSLKNPSHPEYTAIAECGVMCIDFHRTYSYLIAVGLDDGGVAIYNVKHFTNKIPIYQTDDVNKKHNGTVWQVQWGEDLTDGEMVFYSVASDGNVFCWGLMQNQLSQTLIISLSDNAVTNFSHSAEDSGTCIVFHPNEKSVFLVGTEEGNIYKCSTMYISMYLFMYESAHNMPVQRLDYNKYNPEIFASCSSDWSIKIWEDERRDPLFVFDVDCSVMDVKWSTYSSTVLAAVTADCKVRVYDLNIDKYKPICVQSIASKKQQKLTRLAFNWKVPIIVTGNDKGSIMSLKLSPNLRKKPKISKKQQGLDAAQLEVLKLEKVLSLVREPITTPAFSAKHSTDLSSI